MSYHLTRVTKFLDILTVGFENIVVIFMMTRLIMDMIAREMLFLDILPIVIVLVNIVFYSKNMKVSTTSVILYT